LYLLRLFPSNAETAFPGKIKKEWVYFRQFPFHRFFLLFRYGIRLMVSHDVRSYRKTEIKTLDAVTDLLSHLIRLGVIFYAFNDHPEDSAQ